MFWQKLCRPTAGVGQARLRRGPGETQAFPLFRRKRSPVAFLPRDSHSPPYRVLRNTASGGSGARLLRMNNTEVSVCLKSEFSKKDASSICIFFQETREGALKFQVLGDADQGLDLPCRDLGVPPEAAPGITSRGPLSLLLKQDRPHSGIINLF